jgi:hypothetical protein
MIRYGASPHAAAYTSLYRAYASTNREPPTRLLLHISSNAHGNNVLRTAYSLYFILPIADWYYPALTTKAFARSPLCARDDDRVLDYDDDDRLTLMLRLLRQINTMEER